MNKYIFPKEFQYVSYMILKYNKLGLSYTKVEKLRICHCDITG